jgi:hypothetical protein
MTAHGEPEDRGEPPTEWITGWKLRMRLRGHFIGALTLVFISIACASANATSVDGAADEHAHHQAAPLRASNASRPPINCLPNFLTFPNCTPPGDDMTHKKLHPFLMEDPT